jgi:hypothetical protein
MAAAGIPWELEASANAVSASVNIAPPCTVPWLFTCLPEIRIRSFALPVETSISSIPASCAHASLVKNESGEFIEGITNVYMAWCKEEGYGVLTMQTVSRAQE